MGNQDAKSQEDCFMVPVDCRINGNSKMFQKRKFYDQQREQQKQQKNSVGLRRGIKHLAGRKFKQKTIQMKNNYLDASTESKRFDIKISMAEKLFKSLYVVKSFQQKYNKNYPVMILNQSQSLRILRHEISRDKQSHKYFTPSHYQHSSSVKPTNIPQQRGDTQQNESQQKTRSLSELIYLHFTVIERVQWLVMRISQTGRHSNVLKVIKQMDNEYSLNESKHKLQEIYCFVKHIDALNIELMDMLYYQLHNSNEQNYQDHNHDNTEFISCEKHQINKPILINIKETIMKDRILSQRDKQQAISYETCKEKGWEIYKSNQVCFYILAMENQTFIPQFQALEIPQNLSILEIILERYDAFAQMIQVNELSICILIDEKRKGRFHKLMQQNQQKWKRLNIRILLSDLLPVLDIEGNLMFNPENDNIPTVRMASIGSGDLWNCLRDDFDEVQKFDYVQVIGVRNCLQSGFDCFLLGKSKEEGFGWATKVFEPVERLTELRFKREGKQSKNLNFKLPEEKIISSTLPHYMIHPHQIDYSSQLTSIIQSSKPFYAYGNHSILSKGFIKRVIQNIDKKSQRMYRKKIINEDNQKFIVFERDFIDVAINNEVGKDQWKWGLFVCERQGGYYPLYGQENAGVFDVDGCSQTLSLTYLSQLNLSVNRFLTLTGSSSVSCYIDPHVSLQGQGLQDISLEIERRINSLLVSQNRLLNQRVDSIHSQATQGSPLKHAIERQQLSSPASHGQQYPATASRVVATISRVAVLRRQSPRQQQQQIAIYID